MRRQTGSAAGALVAGGILCGVMGAAAADAPGLTVKAPLERQVCQRDGQNHAKVRIAGTSHADADVVEAKADLNSGAERGKAVGWTPIAQGSHIAGGNFAGSLSLEAGGWYTLSVRARRGDDVVAQSQVLKVGVGEVFVTAGQSNSANYGKPRQTAKDDRVVYFDGGKFVPAADPIPGACGSGGSPWSILGDLIARSQQVPVCFRSASLTWTEVKNWLPGVEYRKVSLYDNLVKCVREFPKGGVHAVLWHQGESDSLAGTSAEAYCERLKTVIESLNRDAGYTIPWFVAQASFHTGAKKPAQAEVARGQQLLWKRGIAFPGPNTDELGKAYRIGVHFNQRGLTAHAQRWFDALAAEYEWNTAH